MVYSERGDSSNALQCVTRATAAGSANPTAWYCKGVILERNQLPSDALAAYATATSLNPETPHPYLMLAGLYTTMKRYDDALGVCSNAAKRFPARSEVVSAMARALVRVGRAEEAVRMCRKWLEQKPGDTRHSEAH